MNLRNIFNRVLFKEKDGGETLMRFFNDRIEWQRGGKLHRGGDMPARIWKNGLQEWFIDGKRHRENGPAIVRPCGCTAWYKKDVLLKSPACGAQRNP